jgi:predicted DNA repair protein MutK
MSGLSLLALLDDLSVLLDDIALTSKAAIQRTSGLLIDDLVVSAEQLNGIKSERELRVIYTVAKGSFYNKLLLVPIALLLSTFIPWIILPLLVLGGLYLCYEASEKVLEFLFHPTAQAERLQLVEKFKDQSFSLKDYEDKKIKNAIRTDFILTAEILILILGLIPVAFTISAKLLILAIVSIFVLIGTYGAVVLILRLDDFGLWALRRGYNKLGNFAVTASPKLLKLLTVLGTIAMYIVGGGILLHSLETVYPILHTLVINTYVEHLIGILIGFLAGTLMACIGQFYEQYLEKFLHEK